MLCDLLDDRSEQDAWESEFRMKPQRVCVYIDIFIVPITYEYDRTITIFEKVLQNLIPIVIHSCEPQVINGKEPKHTSH